MAGVHLNFGLDDLEAVRAFDYAATAGDDLYALMDQIGRLLVSSAVERITVTNIDPDGIVWPQSFRAEVFGGPTLHATGHLARSITSEAEARQVVIGSNLIYAGVHQEGAIIRPKTAKGLYFMLADGEEVVVGEVTVPRRAYLGLSWRDVDDVEDLTADFLNNLLEGRPQ